MPFPGFAVLLVGQAVRSLAMIQAGGNFSHQVAEQKRDDHELVTDGLYS
jgi:protein-S-isoprenylcysteine O-methyltransferase